MHQMQTDNCAVAGETVDVRMLYTGDRVMKCEVTQDIPADDELVAVLTVCEAAATTNMASSPAAVANDADPPATATAAEAPSSSPAVMAPRSPPASQGDRVGDSSAAVGERTEDPSTRSAIASPVQDTDCKPCPTATVFSHHKAVNHSRKKDRTVNHPHVATTAAVTSDIEQQRRSFCKLIPIPDKTQSVSYLLCLSTYPFSPLTLLVG